MTTGSTLVIDVTASRRRTDANIAFSWVGRFGMVAGLALGIYIYPYWNFHHVVYTCVALGTLALLLILAVDVPFRALHAHLMVLVGPFSVASYSVAGTEYDDAFRCFRHFDSAHLQ